VPFERRGPERRVGLEEISRTVADVDRVDAGQYRHALVLQCSPFGIGEVPDPTVHRIRKDVGWDSAVDLLHHEERHVEMTRVGFVPAHGWDGHVAAVSDQFDDPSLFFEVVLGEDGDVFIGWSETGDEQAGLAVE
jgi:hypothetical protein